ncbi:zwei Ig domain protein zig-8 [Aphis craccivora]|uniref:Zwei Ig domain protein zig-8 n=1 Tax=Aphis craccivora TaxID=307492 RepID=A0A6G0ZEM7_APHCR|nr:zwei Ig domain protein zig-8 [Aphis craccivora]
MEFILRILILVGITFSSWVETLNNAAINTIDLSVPDLWASDRRHSRHASVGGGMTNQLDPIGHRWHRLRSSMTQWCLHLPPVKFLLSTPGRSVMSRFRCYSAAVYEFVILGLLPRVKGLYFHRSTYIKNFEAGQIVRVAYYSSEQWYYMVVLCAYKILLYFFCRNYYMKNSTKVQLLTRDSRYLSTMMHDMKFDSHIVPKRR